MSLYSVLTFCAEDFCRSSAVILQFCQQVQSGISPTTSSYGALGNALAMLKRHSEALGLISTSAQLKRVEEMIVGNHKTSRSYSPTQLSNALLDVVTRLADELEARKVYIVNLERDPYVDGNRFAVSVSERFPNAIPDMDEGARCFAFERPTACIFHFMRATEYALNVIAELVGIRAFYS